MSNIIKMKMSTNPRLLKDVLTLYKSTFYALKELIDNSIQAKAKRVEINLIPSSCSEDSINYKRIESIEVFDDGEGVPFSMFDNSIMQIATESKKDGKGVGRFGALQIGKEVRIETVAYDTAIGKYTRTAMLMTGNNILSAKDLQKIERYNTIVIYPKKKEFTWPSGKGQGRGLSFKAEDGKSANVTPQEKLVITQMGQQHSAGMLEAAQLIEKGRAFEQARNPAMAAQMYEQAFAKWPSNGKLARRISTMYLVDLRNNSKALEYAKRAIALNKKDGVSALNAAIAAANLRDMSTASTYFDMSVQGSRPSQEALISYALFREEARQYDQALQILAKHDALYGRSLEAMVARARILDKRGAGAQAILSSGFSLPSDLSRFVRARVGMAD